MLKRLVILLAVLGLALSLSVDVAQARPGYTVRGVRHHALGGCVRNTHTHVLACINGYHKFRARTHGKTKTFYEVKYSAQRCSHHECHGRVHTGTIHTPYRLWAKGRKSSSRGSSCGIYTPLCWATDQVQKGEKAIIDHVIKPCAFGGLKGFAGIAATDMTVWLAFKGGIITATEGLEFFTGPVGIGIVSVATCSVGFAESGVNNVRGLFK